jgi:coenzyme F420-reducing hydrogenase delta subunit
MILQLSRSHPRGVLLAGCLGRHCRYGAGARLARTQLEIAQSMLDHYKSGFLPLISDWSGSRSGDSLKSPIASLAEELQASSSDSTVGEERH